MKKPKTPKPKKPNGCARCGSTELYCGGLCMPCAKSFGTWGIS